VHVAHQAMYHLDGESKGAPVLNPKTLPEGGFHCEEDIFEYLGLKYLPPILRNA
jgi:hypothetical protein